MSRDQYWEVFEPLEHEQPEPVAGLISDALADIWRDVKVGILEMGPCANQTSMSEAVWQLAVFVSGHTGDITPLEWVFALERALFRPAGLRTPPGTPEDAAGGGG